MVAGTEPIWRRDGRALFYREYREWATARVPASDLQMVPVGSGDALTLGTPQRLFQLVDPEARSVASAFINSSETYYATADGSRFLVIFRPQGEPLTEIAVLPHWQREIERQSPRP